MSTKPVASLMFKDGTTYGERLSRTAHKHRCMRCNEEFDCKNVGRCVAGYDVLPNIIDPDTLSISPHCPESPDWAWIREYGKRLSDAVTASLRSQLSACQRELEEAQKREQMGCSHPWKCSREYLLMLERAEAAEQQLQQMKEALKRFTSDFECDFVLDGQIVDEPEKRWSVLPELYQIAARALLEKGESK